MVASDSLVEVTWTSPIISAGTGVRIELWDGMGRLATLGYNWDPRGLHTTEVYLPLVPKASDYRVQVVSTWDSQHYDLSDEPFTITGGAVRLHLPNGGEVWNARTLQTIHWKTGLVTAGTGVEFELRATQGKVAELGFAWDPDGEDVNQIFIPNVPANSDYRVHITSTWAPELFDESDASFTILGGPERNAVDDRLWTLYK